ncbi:hypothetical protein IAR55_003142 [Kwoniella newhampshirensis]|uniref:Cx9C motif-containing protein 4, mitochondrial n=1 Tax=Kwoniella newhampshirensis TaxID=1651941 RepID=A0AAW0YPV1_9TREE
MGGVQDCQEQACAIQTCLTRNNYNESKCQSAVRDLYSCCVEMYRSAEKEGREMGGSTACPIRSVVERRMKRFDEEGDGEGKGR